MDKLTQDAERMEEITIRLGDRADIWQDRYVYWMAVAILHIIKHIVAKDARLAREAKWLNEKQK